MQTIYKYLSFLLIVFMFTVSSCKKYVEIPPPDDKITDEAVFTNANSIASAMTGLYAFCFSGGEAGNRNLYAEAETDLDMALASDDAIYNDAAYQQYYDNTFPLTDFYLGLWWSAPYRSIGRANSFIEGVTNSTVITEEQKTNYIAQARLIRGYYYYLLTNIYGDVPLTLNSDLTANSLLPRSPRASVDDAIMEDMVYARDHLSPDEGGDNYSFNQHTANALLARMYGYKKDWTGEETACSSVINSGRYDLVQDPATAFDRGNSEAIYQVPNSGNYFDGIILVGFSAPSIILTLSPSLINTFEPGDLRLVAWAISDGDSYAFNKYSYPSANPQEQVPVRLADVILLRAEARAQQNKLEDAIDDLNLIRERAGVLDLPYTLTQEEVIQAMMAERRKELFSEGITRWFDLSRWGILQSTMAAEKPTTWTPKAAFFPLTTTELSLNPNLKQTPGY